MVHQPRKDNRVKNRIVTAFARALRAAKRLASARAAQVAKRSSNEVHDKDYQVTYEENHVKKVVEGESENQGDQVTEKDNEYEVGEGGEKRTWKKRPRTHDWILSKPAPGGPLSAELIRGYRGHVACDIWENNAWIYEHFPMFRPRQNPNFNIDRHPRAMKWDAQTATPKLISTLHAYHWRLDDMKATKVIWMPYGSDVVKNYPLSLYHGCIRHYSVIEPYMPNRVLRQFGYIQTRPMTPIKPNKEYKPMHSYSVEYGEGMMSFWDSPSSHCLSDDCLGELALDPWECSSDYMSWNSQRTHLKVQNPEHALEGYQPNRNRQLHAEARLHLIAHFLHLVYPSVHEQLSLEEQFEHIDKAIAVVEEFETMNVASQKKKHGAKN